jgi:hypothetical protein
MELLLSQLYGLRWKKNNHYIKLNLGDIVLYNKEKLIITEMWSLRSSYKSYGHIIYAIYDVDPNDLNQSFPDNIHFVVDDYFLKNVKIIRRFNSKSLRELLKRNDPNSLNYIGFNYINGPKNSPIRGTSLNRSHKSMALPKLNKSSKRLNSTNIKNNKNDKNDKNVSL